MNLTGLPETLRRSLPGIWAGLLLAVATLATPAPFAVLNKVDAGRVVAHIFEREAAMALLLGAVLLMLERRLAADRAEQAQTRGAVGLPSQLSLNMGLALGAIACTVVGYYALQPLLADAKLGQGTWSFAQLHGLSFALFGLKLLLVFALAWRAAREASTATRA